MEDNVILIDSRVVGFNEKPCRILSACFKQTGEILVKKEAEFSTFPPSKINKAQSIIVTDAPELIRDWHIAFDAKADLENVIGIYQLQKRAGLVRVEQSVSRYEPSNILQVRKVDKKGILQEFDSTSLMNGHIAVLLSVWASYQILLNYQCLSPNDDEDVDTTLLPQALNLMI